MSPFLVRCFKHGNPIPANAFFILSKGLNTGRPSWEPCPNCFVFTCSDQDELVSYYWLVYSLWAGGKFRKFLVGSVIVFIHLRDLTTLISSTAMSVQDIQKVAKSMQDVLKLETHLQNQLAMIRQAKQAVLKRWIK